MALTTKHKQQLRGLAHSLKPTILIGSNGLTEAVQLEIHRALEDHELIKIKVTGSDRSVREEITQAILDEQAAELIQTVGHIIVIYRVSQKIRAKNEVKAQKENAKKVKAKKGSRASPV